MSSIKLHWLENRSKGGYVTFGVPWKKGEVTKETVFSVNDENGNAIAYQEKARLHIIPTAQQNGLRTQSKQTVKLLK